jgi:hypothetical protein
VPTLDLLKVLTRDILLHTAAQEGERFFVAAATAKRIGCALATLALAYNAKGHRILQWLWQQKMANWNFDGCACVMSSTVTPGPTMKLTKQIQATAIDMYSDIYFVQEIFAVLAFLAVVSVAAIVTFL